MSDSGSLLAPRRAIARRIDRLLGERPEVSCVYVFGSVASGHVDERSDVDIAVVSPTETLPVSEWKGVLTQIGSRWRFDESNSDDPVWAGNALPATGDDGVVDGIRVEIVYQRASDISEVVDEVVNRGAITIGRVPFRPYTLVGMLRCAWLLRDKAGEFAGWLDQTKTYPGHLRRNILRHFVPILRENAEALKENAERRVGPGPQLFFLTRASDALTSILYALNDVYDPADKRAERTILPTLANAPRDFVARYGYVLEGPFDDAGALERSGAFSELAHEVVDMAKADI